MQYRMLIGNQWLDAASGETYDVLDPSTAKVIATVPRASSEDAKAAIDMARDAFDKGPWPRMSPARRGEVLENLARLLEKNADEIASLESLNGGKPIRQASFADIPMAIEHTRHFGRLSATLEDEVVDLPDIGIKSRVVREPSGVCAGILPWNFPLLMAVWKVAPALAAGNTMVLKPAMYTPLTALEYGKMALEAGVPPGVLNIITGQGTEVGRELATNPGVDRLAFTGSTEIGREVMAMGAKTLKRVTLELGGKAPMVVLDDADTEETLRGTLFGAFLHQGQICLSGTRLILPSHIHDAFLGSLTKMAKAMRLGPPSSWETDMGPLISERQRGIVEGYIASGLEEGARLVLGGKRPRGLEEGFYLEPTIFDDVENGMRIAQEEIFGPVLAVLTYEDLEEALDLANGTPYGLAASVWSRDLKRGEDFARRVKAGTVWVNHHHILSCATPHGGYKQSGVGRELGIYGLHEYTELKHLFLDERGEAMKEAFGLVLPE